MYTGMHNVYVYFHVFLKKKSVHLLGVSLFQKSWLPFVGQSVSQRSLSTRAAGNEKQSTPESKHDDGDELYSGKYKNVCLLKMKKEK